VRYLPLLLVPSLALADPPPVDVHPTSIKVALPSVPTFELVAPFAGAISPREVVLKRPIGKDVMVAGYVVAVYRCPVIDTDPTKCERPKLWLGDSKTTAKDNALWIVDVPRPPNKLERERLPKEDLAHWPEVPKVAVGDFVVVRGKFDLASAHGERNSEGLVSFASVTKPSPPNGLKRVAVADEPEPVLAPLPPPPPAKPAPMSQEQRDANLALGMRRIDDAIAGYRKVIAKEPDRDLAYYGLGGALAMKKQWSEARAAFAKAVALRPDGVMYQLYLGEAASESGDADGAREPLLRAYQAEPRLWRAAYYLGRVARDRGHPHAAAVYFGKAIAAQPIEFAPYVALAELYRRWGFTDHAAAVAGEGLKHVVDGQSQLFFALGRAYQDGRAYAKAIEAFTTAGTPRALFERGEVKRVQGDKAGAKRDYEEVVAKANDDADLVQLANQALVELR